MRAVDTNLLVRLLVQDDPAQMAAAVRFIEPGAWISHLVLAETVWVLQAVYRRTRAQLATAVGLLLDHQHLTVQDADVVSAALGHFRRQQSADFSDCLILEIARKAGHAPVGSFDRELNRLPGVVRPR
ncbi:MAG: type II toxin-antitoxin system VapC family toxin [Gammaproteobacteria bacterium]|nr:type II toxin-antitoxin system VapC family toxin [Gammaproteobacteria bacterium]